MLQSALSRTLTYCVVYLGIVVLIATAASSKGMCGDGDFRLPPCGGFGFGVALYGALAIGAVIALVVLVRMVLKRRVATLLKTSAILYAGAWLTFFIPVLAAGNKLAGAMLAMMVLPFSLALLAAAMMCVAVWAGRASTQRSVETKLISF